MDSNQRPTRYLLRLASRNAEATSGMLYRWAMRPKMTVHAGFELAMAVNTSLLARTQELFKIFNKQIR